MIPSPPLPDDLLPAARALATIGVGLHGVAAWGSSGAAVVFASAGSDLWQRAMSLPSADPHPVDALVRDTLAPFSNQPHPWVRCADDEPVKLDFRRLAVAAGLGWSSRLGLVLHPVHGPWIALRAACLIEEPLTPTGPLPAPSPCEACPAPCASACPAKALDTGTWAAAACLPWQATHDSCHGGCLARSACPVGRPSAYDPVQHRYHHHPPSRPLILAAKAGPRP